MRLMRLEKLVRKSAMDTNLVLLLLSFKNDIKRDFSQWMKKQMLENYFFYICLN